MMQELALWTTDVSSGVSEYRSLVEALSDQITRTVDRGSVPSAMTTTNLLMQLLAANQRLQTQLEAAEATLEQQSRDLAGYMVQAGTDPLTGLSNRRVFDDQLAAALHAWNTQQTPVGLILLDIDHFKTLNDTQGHLAGDAVLRQIARLLREHVPSGSTMVRFGGEEFACIVTGLDLSAIAAAAERLRETVESQSFAHENRMLRATISCGVALATFRESAMSLQQRGDSALYAAKTSSRNAVYLHDGYHCVHYSGGNAAAQPTALEENAMRDFEEVCFDLRQRLAQVAITPEVQPLA
jgi:diguanylate cyclase (GGDEF)-like protein